MTTIHPRVFILTTIIHFLEDFLRIITPTRIRSKSFIIGKDIAPWMNFLHNMVHLPTTLVHPLQTMVHPLHTLVHPLILPILLLLHRSMNQSPPTILLQVILHMALSTLRMQVLLLFHLIKGNQFHTLQLSHIWMVN
jgi:hypothetical protein